ncbi:hypothetical protein ACP275_14G225000 [Erythranthe tilingii]
MMFLFVGACFFQLQTTTCLVLKQISLNSSIQDSTRIFPPSSGNLQSFNLICTDTLVLLCLLLCFLDIRYRCPLFKFYKTGCRCSRVQNAKEIVIEGCKLLFFQF